MFFGKPIKVEEIVSWIHSNFNSLLFVCAFAVLSALAFVGWNWQKSEKEKEIQNLLYGFQYSLKEAVKDSEKQKKKPSEEKKSEALPFTQKIKDKARLYEEALKQNHGHSVSVVFAIDLADFYYKRGEEDKAKELLSHFALPKKSSNNYHLASFQLASYYMSEKNCDKALPVLSALIANDKAGFLHLEARLQQAICLEHLERYNQALRNYEEIINRDPEGYTGRLAKDYKRLLLLKRNLEK